MRDNPYTSQIVTKFDIGVKIVLIRNNDPKLNGCYRSEDNPLLIGETITVEALELSISNDIWWKFEEFSGSWRNVNENFITLNEYRQKKLERILK